MSEVGLSFRAVEVLGLLERRVGSAASLHDWVAALAEVAREGLADVHVAPGDLDAVLDSGGAAASKSLTRADVVSLASVEAVEEGHTLVAPRDVARALLDASARLPAPTPTVPPVQPPTVPPVQPPTRHAGGPVTTFRVFVNSTFDDFAFEREVLRREVWPSLRTLCLAHGARFQAVDLRWGVSEEAALDQQTVPICLEEIERCREVTPRPNFLVLLGNRYGWRPPPPSIPASTYEAIGSVLAGRARCAALVESWYERDDNAVPAEYRLRRRSGPYVDATSWAWVESRLARILRTAARAIELTDGESLAYTASATEQEIAAGALQAAAPDAALCVVRSITEAPGSAADADSVRRRFFDEDPRPAADLVDRVRARLPGAQVLDLSVAWGVDGPRLDEAYADDFARAVRCGLERSITEELTHPTAAAGAPDGEGVDAEVEAHRRFAAKRRRSFTGREEELRRIAAYLNSDDARPLVVQGVGGSGKSALLAEVLGRAEAGGGARVVVARFVGVTPRSSDGRALLGDLCRELARRTPGESGAAPRAPGEPGDLGTLGADFRRHLAAAGASSPVVVLIDAVDQLTGSARRLAWVPPLLPPGVRMVLSTRPGGTLAALVARGADTLELGGLNGDEGAGLLATWLEEAHRQLRPRQHSAVLAAFEQSGGNPLYLRLAFEEARRWRSGEGEPPEELAIGVQALVEHNLLTRLEAESAHGGVLVAHALGYLAASRHGLAEDELLDLLSRDPELYRWFLLDAFHLPGDFVEGAERSPSRPEGMDAREWVSTIRDAAREAETTGMESGGDLDALIGELVPARLPRRGDLDRLTARPRTGPTLPVVLWSRLAFDLAPYLMTVRGNAGDLLTFFHAELGDACRERYLTGGRGAALHSRMAEYFHAEADPDGDGRWAGGNGNPSIRGLSELPHHLAQAGQWDELYRTLVDFAFLEQKAEHVDVRGADEAGDGAARYGGVFALEADFEEALRLMPDSSGAAGSGGGGS